MTVEIERECSCLGETGGTGRPIVRDAVAKGHSVAVLVRSKASSAEIGSTKGAGNGRVRAWVITQCRPYKITSQPAM